MSEMNEPRNKRQKCDGGETVVLGGPMYDEATARKMLRAVPRVFDMDEKEGFNPDDAALNDFYRDGTRSPGWEDYITPMIYFVEREDLKMCRYLISRGASTTKTVDDFLTPMHAAAFAGQLDLLKLLLVNGAQGHVGLTNTYGWTPFLIAANKGHDDLVRWLVLHGALCNDDNSDDVVGDLIHHERYKTRYDSMVYNTCERLVDWSKDVLQTHSSMVTFLLGTLPPTPDNDRGCILKCLSGHPGIRENIGDFVGLEVTKAKQLRILRSVVEVLPETMRIGRK